MKRISMLMALACLLLSCLPLSTYAAQAPASSAASAMAASSDDASKDAKKDKKKKEKKKKKDKEVKSPEEIIALLQEIEWKKPAKSGLDVDKYYDDADEFFKMVKTVGDSVSLFKVCKVVSSKGDTIIAPVDIRTNTIRHKNEAFAQVMESVSFATSLGLKSALLATGAVAYAIQIGQDAIPFVGNPERKAANVQIAKAVKVFPLFKQLMDSQRSMMNRYFKKNANAESSDDVTEAQATGDLDFLEIMNVPDDELDAYRAAEENAN